MRKLLAVLIGGAALLPAAAAAGPVVRDGPHPVPDVRIRAPQAGVGWQAPMRNREMRRGDHRGGFNRFAGYRVIHRGGVVPGYWRGPRYGIGNWGMYGFGQPAFGTRWVRYYDDALLIDRNGRVHDGRYGLDFDRYGERWGRDDRGIPVYVGDGDYYPEDRDYNYAERFEREGGRDLAYDRDYPYDYRYGGQGVAYGWGGGGYTITETTVTSAPTVIERVEYLDAVKVHRPSARRHYRARKHAYRAKAAPRCVCN